MTLKQEYLAAESPEKRLIIGMRGANAAWEKTGSSERFPTLKFYEEFLDPFIQEEKHKLQLQKVHHITQRISRKEEREHAEAATFFSKQCVARLAEVE